MRSNNKSKKKHSSSSMKQKGARSHGRPTKDDNLSKLRCVAGIHSVNELLKVKPKSIQEIWFSMQVEQLNKESELVLIWQIAKKLNLKIKIVSPQRLDKVLHTHQGVCAYTDFVPQLDWTKLKDKKQSIILAIDEIQDPHNLGAVMRTAWLMGVDGIITPKDKSVSLTPSAVKVACGGAEHIAVDYVGNLAQAIEKFKDMGYWVYGLAGEATESVWQMKFPEKVLLITGSEDKGLRKRTRSLCDHLLNIPQIDANSSYNASVATAICLAEVVRQN